MERLMRLSLPAEGWGVEGVEGVEGGKYRLLPVKYLFNILIQVEFCSKRMNIIDTKSDLAFKRILMYTAKVYSRQFSKNDQYSQAQPVYSLNLLDHRLKPNENQWYHHYTFSNRHDHNDYMEEMQIILVELPKWRKLNKFDISKPQDRWLMYFTQPTLFERLTPEEYARYSEIYEALESLESKNLTPEQIRGYELYVDSIRQYHTTMSIEREEGWKDGLEKGRKEGHKEGAKKLESVLTDLKSGISIDEVADKYNFEKSYIEFLHQQFILK
jgi:predicted transposase/invertase (TIGR01784 family)